MAISARRRVRTAASTSAEVRQADQYQQSLRQGPTLEGRDRSSLELVVDTREDDRWPLWCDRIASLGLRSVVSVALHTDERTIGALNFCSRTAGSFTASDAAVAMTFARHASIALATSDEIFNLKIAVDSRKVVGQAQGILMERFGIGQDRAFEVLRRYSQSSNVKLSAVAQRVVDERQLPASRAVSAPLHDADVAEAFTEATPISITSRDDPTYRVLVVAGDIDILTAPDFVTAALAAIESGHLRVVVDLSATSFVDSSGLSAFVVVEKAISRRGGTLDVVAPVDRVHRVFSMSGLDAVIHLHATLDDAKASRTDLPAGAGRGDDPSGRDWFDPAPSGRAPGAP